MEKRQLCVVVRDLAEIGLSLSHDRGDYLREWVRQTEVKNSKITTRTERKGKLSNEKIAYIVVL